MKRYVGRKEKFIFVYCSLIPRTYPNSIYSFVQELSRSHLTVFVELEKPRVLTLPLPEKLRRTMRLMTANRGLHHLEFHTITAYIFLAIKCVVMKLLGFRVILLTNVPNHYRIYRFIPADRQFFDCTDQFEPGAFSRNKKRIRSFDGIFVNSAFLKKTLSSYHVNVRRVSPGYVSNSHPSVPKEKIAQSIIYTGGISKRLDFPLLIYIAKALPGYHFFFAGEIFFTTHYPDNNRKTVSCIRSWNSLCRLPNVHYMGTFSRDEIPSVIALCRVGLLPYDIRYFMNRYSHPMKLYDYCLARIPSVSTNLPVLADMAANTPLFISKTPEEFVKNLRYAMNHKAPLEMQAKNLYRTAGIKMKVTQILMYVRSADRGTQHKITG